MSKANKENKQSIETIQLAVLHPTLACFLSGLVGLAPFFAKKPKILGYIFAHLIREPVSRFSGSTMGAGIWLLPIT